MKKLIARFINWCKSLHFHKYEMIQDIDPLEEVYPEYYLDSYTQIEKCMVCGLLKRTLYLMDFIETSYEKPNSN